MATREGDIWGCKTSESETREGDTRKSETREGDIWECKERSEAAVSAADDGLSGASFVSAE